MPVGSLDRLPTLPLPSAQDRSPRSQPADRRSRPAIGTCLLLWLVFRLYQLALGCAGDGTDVALYHDYADQLRSGAAAGPQFRPEYPPGALTLFLLPATVTDDVASYHDAFAVLMAMFDLAICLLVFERARLRPRAPPQHALLHATLYLLISAALWPVLYARFDLVPAALVLGALHCLDRGRDRWSWTLLGVAVAVKLWPLALAPLWVISTLGPRGDATARPRFWTRIAIGLSCAVAGAALASLPVLPMIYDRFGTSVDYLAARGIQIESPWANVALLLARSGKTEVRVEEAFGSTQLAGPLPTLFAALALPMTVLPVLLPLVAVLLLRRRRAVVRLDDGEVLEHAVLAIALGCMIPAKVLSPQFVIWVAPLLALVARGPAGAVLAFLTAALTTEVYPAGFNALAGWEPGHGRALVTLTARNALLIGWYATALYRLFPRRVRSGVEAPKQFRPIRRLGGGPILPLRPARSPVLAPLTPVGASVRVGPSSGDLDLEAQ